MGDKVKCPSCGNPECLEDDNYCFNCGIELNNYCTDEECSSRDEQEPYYSWDVCYCPRCGSKSSFFEKGFIEPMKFAD